MGLKWGEYLSVGNDVIDTDHKYFIEIVNRVENGLALKDHGEMMKQLNGLSQYAVKHFEVEEKIAGAVGYSQVPGLHDSHQALLDKVIQVGKDLKEEWTSSSEHGFTTLLREWVLHVIKEDMLIKPFFMKYSPKFDPR